MELPSIDNYLVADGQFKKELERYVAFFKDKDTQEKYLSKTGDELIQLYEEVPIKGKTVNVVRGIFPRKAFYTIDYKRYSIWAFIFNRNGQVLLQQRSKFTADNRLLWDKSSGGHVDLGESSTIMTVRREVIEELFLKEAEYTLYVQEKGRDFIDFGEWNTDKRSEYSLSGAFDNLDDNDWVIFRPVDRNGLPMTIDRSSYRRMHVKDVDENGNYIPVLDKDGKPQKNEKGKNVYQEHIENWPTIFISDVYLLISPEGYIDTDEQMNNILSQVEEKGAQSSHRLMNVEDLIKDVEKNSELYTDDMRDMIVHRKWLLIQFANFVKDTFAKK